MTEFFFFLAGVAVGLAVAWYLGDRKRKRDLDTRPISKAAKDSTRTGRTGHALDD